MSLIRWPETLSAATLRRHPALQVAAAGLIALCLLHPQRAGAAPGDRPTGAEIFDATITYAEKRQTGLRAWQYYSTFTSRQYDDDGAIVGKGAWRTLVRPGERDSVQVLSEKREGKLTFVEDKPDAGKDGKAKRDAEREDEKSRPRTIAEAARKYGLRDRYTWTRLADETVGGEKVFVVQFEPRPGYAAKNREERFMNQLAGKMWVSQEDFSAVKVAATLRSPYRLFWILARVTEFELTYELPPTRGDRLLRLTRAHVKTSIALPFNKVHQQHWLAVEKYEPRTARKE